MDMNSLMQNPQMMAMAQQMMQDPEVMRMMQDPATMQRLQSAMGNPAAMADLQRDPAMQNLMSRMGGMGMGGGGGGGMGAGMGGMGGFGGLGAGAGAGAAAGAGRVIHLSAGQDLHKIIKDAGNKLVVVDYFATWCGPCKRIAPAFESLASEYAEGAVFVKVDGDQHRSLVQAQGVKGYPTFQMFVKGSKVEEFSGADESRLRSQVAQYANVKVEAPCPYKHFPSHDAEMITYKKIKYSAVLKLARKNSAEVGGAAALTDEEVAHLEGVATKMEDKQRWHATDFTPKEYAAVEKLLGWPVAQAGAGLHLARVMALHPLAAKHFAKQVQDPACSPDIAERLLTVASTADRDVTKMNAVRALANFFGRRVLTKAICVAERAESLLDALATIMEASRGDDARKGDLRKSCLAVLFNMAIVSREDSAAHEGAKTQTLSSVLEFLGEEDEAKSMYQILVLLGTLVYRDPTVQEIAQALELPTQVEAAMERFADNANVVACGKELLAAIEEKPQE